jgi:uncharacterized cupin superfamily protein
MARPNVFTEELESQEPVAGFAGRSARLGDAAGSERLGASIYELGAGQTLMPYHYHRVGEEMLVVLRGRPTLRTPEGERQLEEGAVASFVVGPAGAHQVINRSDETVRYLMLSTNPPLDMAGYPDTGKVGLRIDPQAGDEGGKPLRYRYYEADPVDYFEGEEAPS